MNEVSSADRGSNPHAPSDGRIGEGSGGVAWLSDIGSRTERAFGPPEQELAALFATHTSRIAAGAGVDIAAEAAASRLQDALRGREVIARAQGVVTARQGVSAEVASAGLRRSSRQAHIPLRRQSTEITASTQRQPPRTGRTMRRPFEALEQARRYLGLSQGELWLRYFQLGGMSTAFQVEAYLYGALIPTPHGGDHPVPDSDDR